MSVELAAPPIGADRTGSGLDVVYVLCLLQVASGVLASLGEVALMGGNPGYVVLPVVKAGLVVFLATKLLSGRRWAAVTLIVLQAMTIVGYLAPTVLSLVPSIGATVNLVGLLTNVATPIAVIVLIGHNRPPRRRPRSSAAPVAAYGYPIAQDPFAPPPTDPAGPPVPVGPPVPAGPPVPVGPPVPAGAPLLGGGAA